MASPEQPVAKPLLHGPPPSLLCLTDDLLAEIFLRLPALADVGRSATACPAFRRVVLLWFRPSWRYWAYGCFYWKATWAGNLLLVLDTRRMEFSTMDIPLTCPVEHCSAIIEAGDGSAGTFTARKDMHDVLYSFRQIDIDPEGGVSWDTTQRLRLPSGYSFIIAGSADRYMLLRQTPKEIASLGSSQIEYFSLDLETMQLDKVCGLKDSFLHLSLCTGFPPSLSLPSL